MKIINIDHHRTTKGDGDINIVDPSYPAVAELIYDILTCMEIKITEQIAINLFMGIFSDTGGFKYSGISPRTFQTAGDLISIYPEMDKVVAKMETSNTLHNLDFLGLAISSTEEILGGKAFVSIVPNSKIVEKKIPAVCISAGVVSSMLRTVGGYLFSCAMVEAEPNQIRMSFRSSDATKYDVSKLAAIFGGGGHKAAAGAVLNMSIEEAKSLVETKAKELYNL
jgi:phosphoesterase RecJ-like protein